MLDQSIANMVLSTQEGANFLNVCAIKPDVIIPEKEDWLWVLLLWQPISLYSLFEKKKSYAFLSFSSVHKISLQEHKRTSLAS